jgi:hypothetical protein
MSSSGITRAQHAVPVEAVRALDLAAMGVTGQILLRADDIAHAAGARVAQLACERERRYIVGDVRL